MRARPRKLVFALAGFAAALLAALIVLLVVAAYKPLPLGPLRPIVEATIERHIAPYRISANSLEGRWNPASLAITIIGEQIDLVDASGLKIATVPRAETDVAFGFFVRDAATVEEVRLIRPSFAVFRTPNGTIRVQLGAADRHQDPRIITQSQLDRLTDLIACCEAARLPQIKVSQGSLSFVDEASGTKLRFDEIALAVRLDGASDQAQASLTQLVGDQRLQYSVRIDRGPEPGGFTVLLQPHNVYPAVLGDVLPPGDYLRPFEVPVSGTLGFRFDQRRRLQAIDLNLRSGAGSLEVVEYHGDNLNVGAVRARGSIDIAKRTVRLDEAVIHLADGQVALSGTLRKEPKRVVLDMNALLSNLNLSRLLPRWFAGLPAMLNNEPAAGSHTTHTLLAMEGSIRPEAGLVDLGGEIMIRDEPADADGRGDVRRVVFRLSGQTRAPQLLVRSTSP